MDYTKINILETAQGLFGKYGFSKTSVDEIAKKAHVAKGTIYHYFKSKVYLLEAVIKKEETILRNELEKNVNAAETPQEKLRAFIMTRFMFVKNLSNYYNAINEEYLVYDAFIKKVRQSDFNKDVAMIEQILEEGEKRFIFQNKNVYFTSLALLTAIHGLEYPMIINADLLDFESMVDELLHIILKGIEV
ncbi:MAG TPA: TetR/AcrR family transcriptional regulator [Bacteroidota bacterium]|nr:TetR/AcrR family transcriptional regulator [Candidatus Kapabacteria bacterium]HRS02183.1 TetR/AcrR family transcriptional regulator [Bacteroidota bacterium]